MTRTIAWVLGGLAVVGCGDDATAEPMMMACQVFRCDNPNPSFCACPDDTEGAPMPETGSTGDAETTTGVAPETSTTGGAESTSTGPAVVDTDSTSSSGGGASTDSSGGSGSTGDSDSGSSSGSGTDSGTDSGGGSGTAS